MNKNIKNKVLAFTMASAMIVPNVAVVFAEAPKAGLATVSKNADKINSVDVGEGQYAYTLKLCDSDNNDKIVGPFNKVY